MILWEKGMSTWCVVSRVLLSLCSSVSPRGWGFAPPFIDQGGGGLHAHRSI
jgi:hypothetical protein